MEKKNIIIKVEKNSIAEEIGISPGDTLVSINDLEVKDIFDYRYMIKEEYIEALIISSEGEEIIYEIEKDEDEDLGIIFADGLMDEAKSCKNKCIFCFIDQLPKGMRDTLYFKDDDSRLSFLQGNYVTLTNMKEEDLNRIIFYHLSPINISVHTTDPELRYFMLKNPNAKNIMQNIQRLYDSNLLMNFQIVLCKNINDGENLNKTINDLSKFIGNGLSLSVVPVGISNYRENLFELSQFEKEDCIKVISQITSWQEKFLKEKGTRFVYASDEFYLKAEIEMPPYENYENFPQIENGVGMISSFEKEFNDFIGEVKSTSAAKKVTVITGSLAYKFILNLSKKFMDKFENINVEVVCVTNNFFGNQITVSGLLTGTDIISTLEKTKIGDKILIPENTLRAGEKVFLDDITVDEVEKIFNTKVMPVKVDGKDFINALIG